MIPKVISILILGGSASSGANGFSMPHGHGYVPRLLEQLKRAGWQVQIECHSPVDLNLALSVLHRLNLSRFDLILLELGHQQLTIPQPSNTDQLGAFVRSAGRLMALRLLNWANCVPQLRQVDSLLLDLLYYLQPCRHRLVLLTPFPHPQSVSHWLRMRGRDLFWKHARRTMIPVFDTNLVLGQGEEFFADEQQGYLSGVAGDLLGQSLFDFIQINTLLPARPERHQRRGM
jgi:hypothetical protein